MVTISTNLRNPREAARTERFEPTGTITATDVQSAIAQVSSSSVSVQRSITGSGDLPILATDSILNINIVAPLAITALLASSRNGVPLTLKNMASSTADVTLNRTAPDTFDGQTSLLLGPGQSVTIRPAKDGVNAGYMIL